ncbi:2-thiouracil desulfurase family protein [Streptomonospora wellingtoniae]|uniref:DUF523 and DUF1722 domain-containing protein n=1 Tax=Streptomonospora wellingtoniae TaxID=3075544 RepID=A0ABU2KQY9_9ACTN|nr:DUF523 and DUF1722 domain-containing protein [Streptomonospora sp. DSM 45055]MDT0301689.1 DUF523 and DUF1722 domain-containing protein [Streptomonospora sp. DSM 45055]
MAIHADARVGARPRVGVPSCLLGSPVSCDGGRSRSRFLADVLDRHVDWVPVCPEGGNGPGVLRERPRLERAGSGGRAASRSRADRTDDPRAASDRRFEALDRLDGCVLKDEPPGCGLSGPPVDERPDPPVEEQGRLRDPGLRERFVERVFARARLRALFAGARGDGAGPAPGGADEAGCAAWRPRELVAFHARNKLQLMAHSPEGYRATGRIAAEAGSRPPEEVRRDYTAAFTRALARPASPGRNANALQHAFGMISDRLDGARRRDLVDAVDRYREGLVPLSVPIDLIRYHADAASASWVREQTYLDPYPADLRLRDSPAAP